MNSKMWIAIAGVEALAIALLAANTLQGSGPGDTTAHRALAARQEVTRASHQTRASPLSDAEALRAVIRSELAVLSPKAGTTPSPAMRPARDAALDQLRRSALHRQMEDYLRSGEIGEPELRAFQEQTSFLEAAESDAALSRIFRAINHGELRVSFPQASDMQSPENSNEIQ